MSFRSGCFGRLFALCMAAAAFCCGVLPAPALIGPQYQLLLGNPSGATADPNNHNNYLILRNAYALDYSATLRQPNWASWNYTTNDTGSSGRGSFATDTNLPAGFYQVKTTDYQGSGYDRGHLCPSGDRTVSVAINEETFLMSNMMPQAPDNNQGVWANLEIYSRAIAASNEVLVICGPEGFGGAVTDSAGQIPIASNVWKIIVAVPLGAGDALSRISSDTRVIAVNIPNIQGIRTAPWQNYLTSANHLQTNTGFTFFSALNSNLATVLRAKIDGAPATGITNFVPAGGVVSNTVTLRGTNFTGTTTVWFNGIPATFAVDSPNQIIATVPSGATTGPISVIAAGGISTSPTPFTVTTPIGEPPPLQINLAAASVILSWPTNAVGFQLQLSPRLSPAQWTNHTGPVTITGTNYTVTVPTPDGRMFFRLQNP